MARTAGSRNADFDASREGLVRALLEALPGERLAQASLRELAGAAGVSVATLRHYFGARTGVIEACLERMHREGLPYLLEVASGPLPEVRTSLRWLMRYQLEGLRQGVGDLHRTGLAAGMGEEALGPAYLRHLLEPSLQAIEARLARHVAAGELNALDVRHAALALVSPLLLGWLHQRGLGGDRCRPLDLEALADDTLEAFLRAHAAPAPRPPSAPARPEASPPVRARRSR